jgi:uncharacterized protein (DUF1697 family)
MGWARSSGTLLGTMVYVAFLRGINVGRTAIVSMTVVREALLDFGLSDVRTYINSGNVIFSTRASDTHKLGARLEKALEQRTGVPSKVLVMDHKGLKKLVDAIPRDWVDDKTMRTYVHLLWKELDDRKNIAKSRMNRIVGTPDYKLMTIRSANTMRKLAELSEL